jgi:hypothetical protein
MDTTAQHAEIVKQVIQRYAQLRPSHGDIRLDTVSVDQRRSQRVYGTKISADASKF